MQEVESFSSWNKTRIFAVLFLIIILATGAYFFRNHFMAPNSSPKNTTSVKGASVEKPNLGQDLNTSIQQAIKEKINNLKQEVSNLDLMEVASSSPQVQKVLNDIKSLEQYPTNQVKEICKKICGL